MAHFHGTIYTCTFLLAIIACHDILFTEGRQLKSMKKQDLNSNNDQKNMGMHGSNTMNSYQKPLRNEDDLSAVGEVPSADLSAARKKVGFPPQAPTQNHGFMDSVEGSVDDFRPTKPGNSPGVGHSFTDHNVNIQPEALGNAPAAPRSTAGNSNDFRPTTPGHSPGVGHSLHNKNARPNV